MPITPLEHDDRQHHSPQNEPDRGQRDLRHRVQPGGALSGRTHSRFGRRDPWLLGAALATLVLSNPENAARDLGVLNIANAGPQMIAPFVAAAVLRVRSVR